MSLILRAEKEYLRRLKAKLRKPTTPPPVTTAPPKPVSKPTLAEIVSDHEAEREWRDTMRSTYGSKEPPLPRIDPRTGQLLLLERRHELAMVTAAPIRKILDPGDRKALVKSLRRWLERQPGVNRAGVRNALGANPHPGEITTRRQAEQGARQEYLRRRSEKRQALTERDRVLAERAARDPRYQAATGNRPGLVRSAFPRVVGVAGEPALLTYRGILVPGDAGLAALKHRLQRPKQAWHEQVAARRSLDRSSRAETGGKKSRYYVAERTVRGGLAAQGMSPSGAAISTSTNPQEAALWANAQILHGRSGAGALGAYAVPIPKLIQEALKKTGRPRPRLAMGNAKYRTEREISQINGGNLVSVRKVAVSGGPMVRQKLLTVPAGGMKEFRYEGPTPQQERSGLLKTGLLAGGLAVGGGLAGLGLYRAGVSTAAKQADRFKSLLYKIRDHRLGKVRAAQESAAAAAQQAKTSATAAAKQVKAQEASYRKAAEAYYDPRSKENLRILKKVKPANVAASTPAPVAPPVAKTQPAPPAKTTIPDLVGSAPAGGQPYTGVSEADLVAEPMAKTKVKAPGDAAKPARKLTLKQQRLAKRQARVAKFAAAQSTPSPAAVPKAPKVEAPKPAAPKKATPVVPKPAAVSAPEFWEKRGIGKVPLTGTPEANAALRQKLEEIHGAGGFKGKVVADVVDEARQSLAKPAASVSEFPAGLSEALREAGRKNNPQPRGRKKAATKASKGEDEVAKDIAASPEEEQWESAHGQVFKNSLPDVSDITPDQRRALQRSRATKKANRMAKAEAAAKAAAKKGKAKGKKNFVARLRRMLYFDQFQTDEGGIPLTGRVARDRFVKKIRDEDLDRRDANLLRAGAAGGLAGLLLKAPPSAGKRALIGAGAGGVGVIGIRALTNNDRDIYGERNRGGKRAELVPAIAGLGAAGYLASRRLRGLATKIRGVKEFDDYRLYYFKGRNTGIAARSAEEARKKKKRGGDELVAVRTPSDSEKSQMARGVWVRTRRDGKSPEKSRYGKGRGQGPARKSMGAKILVKFFEQKKEGIRATLTSPYAGAALSGFGSGAGLGALSLLKRGTTLRQGLGNAGKLGLVSGGIVGGGAWLGSRLVGDPRKDEGAPFTKRAAIGGAIVGTGAGLGGAVLLRRTRAGARALLKAADPAQPFSRAALALRKTPLAGAAALGAAGGALYGGGMGADEGQQVDSIRNLRKDLKKKKEFQVSAYPNVESLERTRQRRSSERAAFLKTVGLAAGLGAVGLVGGRVGYAAGRANMRAAAVEAEARAARAEASAARAEARASRAERAGGSAGGFSWEDIFGRARSARSAGARAYDDDYVRRSQEARRQQQQSRTAGSSGSQSGAAQGAQGVKNPYAGTPKAEAWEKWKSMDRMATESPHEGERVAAAIARDKWKKRHNLARRLRGVRLFGRADQPRDPVSKRYKDPLWSWATGERLISIGPDGKQRDWSPESPQLVNSAIAHAARARVPLQRGTRMSKDVSDVLQGKERERDSSGRIKKREWEKSWFQNALATAGIGLGTLTGAAAWRYGRMNPQSRFGRFVGNVETGARKSREDFARMAGGVMRSANDMTGRNFAALPSPLRELDAIAGEAGWDVRDPRGRSARVFAPGSRRRERREKYWHEKKENQQKLWIAGTAAALGAGTLAGVGVYRLAQGKSIVPKLGRAADPQVATRRADGTFAGRPVDPSSAGKGGRFGRMKAGQSPEETERLRKWWATQMPAA